MLMSGQVPDKNMFAYVVGDPTVFTLAGWDPAEQGTTYRLQANGCQIGANGLQIGLPSDSSAVNAQAVIASALTIASASVITPDTNDTTSHSIEIVISAVHAPSRDLRIAIFGLEVAE